MSRSLTIEPLGATIDVREGQTLLDAALRQGIYIPHACGHGLCGTCKVHVAEGEVDRGAASPFALMDFECDEGKTLACCATLLSDATIEADIDDEPQRLSVLAMANYDLGKRAASDSAIAALHDEFADAFPLKIAKAHAWRGEREHAFRWLDRAVNEGHSIEGIKNDPFLSVLHADQRWQPLLESLGLDDALTATIQL